MCAFKTSYWSVFAHTKNHYSTWTVVQKPICAFSDACLNINLTWLSWYQTPQLFHPHSTRKKDRNLIDVCCVLLFSDPFEYVLKRNSKMLGRNWVNLICGHFKHVKSGSFSQTHFYRPSSCSLWPHMKATRSPFSKSSSCFGELMQNIQ